MVVERLHVERAVDGNLTIVGDGVAQRRAVLLLTTTHPVVGSGVVGIGIHPVEDGQLVQRQLIGSRKRLAVVQRTAEVLDAGPHRVFPCRVAVGIEVFVDGLVAVGFLNLSLCARLEVHVEVLGEVPAQREVTVPQELRVEGDRQRRTAEVVHVALLQFVVAARHLGVERDVLRQPVESEGLGQRHPLRLRLRLLEGFPRLVDGRIAVVQRAAPLVVVLIDGGLARRVAMGVAVAEREVGRVVRHRVTLGLDVEAHVGQREVGRRGLGDGNVLYRVALLLVGGIEGVVEVHIGVQRIILRLGDFLGDRVVERCRHLQLVGEQLAQLDGGGQRVGLVVVGGACCHTVLQSAEALGDDLSREVERADIRQLHVERSRCCPAATVDDVLQAQLVDPHLARLDAARQVAHTNHHRLDFAQCGVTHHADTVVGLVGVVVAIERGIAGGAHGACHVAGLLHLGKDAEVDVEHVLSRPYGTTVVYIILIIVAAVGRQLQGDDILVVVVLVVATHADEHRQLVVLEVGGIVDEVVGMDEHLEVLILAQVEDGIAVDGLRLASRQVLHHHVQGLLVGLGEL